jgi:two-component system chemotaxis response regulator CheB
VLAQILDRLPLLESAVLIVQHMPKFINDSLVRTLGQHSRAPVRLARHNERTEEGVVYVAPSDVHCQLATNSILKLVEGPRVNYVCPAIDVTMSSVSAPFPGQRLVGVLLTGMGKDGAQGLAHMKRLGALTIAQDRASCTVYGMPGEAVKLGCVDHELPPEGIARALTTVGLRMMPEPPPRTSAGLSVV